MLDLPKAPISQDVWNSLTEEEKGAIVKRDFPTKYPLGLAWQNKDDVFAAHTYRNPNLRTIIEHANNPH
jgi:hypothetical protein